MDIHSVAPRNQFFYSRPVKRCEGGTDPVISAETSHKAYSKVYNLVKSVKAAGVGTTPDG